MGQIAAGPGGDISLKPTPFEFMLYVCLQVNTCSMEDLGDLLA